MHRSDAQMQISDGQHSMHHVNYVQEHDLHHMSDGNVMDDEHDDVNGVGGSEAVEGDAPSDPGSLSDNRCNGDNGDQLTLSFQGQVYVFDSVSPEKVIFASLELLYFELILLECLVWFFELCLCNLKHTEIICINIIWMPWMFLLTVVFYVMF